MSINEREIALDTETTGFKPHEGHRLVEIGCVEMINRVSTGNNFHVYINPERDMPDGAFNVHGLSERFLSNKPKFAEIADDFLKFIGNSKLIIHNADFDMNFLNAELLWIRKREIPLAQAFCTLKYARKKFPGSPASLDALCKRFDVDNSNRTLHGALLDAELLADMYLELMGGKQVTLELGKDSSTTVGVSSDLNNIVKNEILTAREFSIFEEESLAHAEFMKKIKS